MSQQLKTELEQQGYEIKIYPVEHENCVRGRFIKYKAEAFKNGELVHWAFSNKDYEEAVDHLYHQLNKF